MISNLQKPPLQRTTAKPKANSIGVSPILTELAYVENTDVFTKLKTSCDGLSRAVAEARHVPDLRRRVGEDFSMNRCYFE